MAKLLKKLVTHRRYLILSLLNKVATRFGYSFQQKGLGYFDAKKVIKEARKRNLSVCEYLESNNVSGVGKRRDQIIETLFGILPNQLTNVLEVGTGTGMYMEKIIEHYRPTTYESYETNLGWVDYLQDQYNKKVNLISHNANGLNLSATASNTVDAVFSHGVFVYLPLILSVGYLEELVRVCKTNGFIVFDCFVSDAFGLDVIKKWQQINTYFPVVVPVNLITEFAADNNLKLVHSFNIRYHECTTRYFIFQKNG
jgi:phospholipid N-methyltransferase